MIIFPPAKINIGLYVTDRRADGYHDIETLFYPIGLSDMLEAVIDSGVPAGSHDLTVTGMNVPGPAEDNLVARACQIFGARHEMPGLKVHLHKGIPMGAGLGGGSSDGAAMLMLLNRLLRSGLAVDELAGAALELGSDCPFFLNPEPSFARGRGELLSAAPISLKGYHLQLYHPGTGISTARAYQHVHVGRPARAIEQMTDLPPDRWRGLVSNVFEPFAVEQLPVIAFIRDELYRSGAVFASMTGSGSAVYGLFETGKEAPPSISRYLLWKEELSQ